MCPMFTRTTYYKCDLVIMAYGIHAHMRANSTCLKATTIMVMINKRAQRALKRSPETEDF